MTEFLFAYTKEPSGRIVRFELDAAVQPELRAFWNTQIEAFNCNEELIAFDGNYKADAAELLFIDNFDDIDALAEAVADPGKIPKVEGDEDVLGAVKALFVGREEEGQWVVYLQAFDRRRLMSVKGFSIFHDKAVFKRIESAGLTLDTRIAAKLVGKKLYFRDFFYARQIFDLSSYYQEATDADIQKFAEVPGIHVPDLEKFRLASDSWVRRKIWLIQQSTILQEVPMQKLKEVAAGFDLVIESEVGQDGVERLVIPEGRREIKNLLRYLDEDYYKSSLTSRSYRTNSKRLLPAPARQE